MIQPDSFEATQRATGPGFCLPLASLPGHDFDHLLFDLVALFAEMSLAMMVRAKGDDVGHAIRPIVGESNYVMALQIGGTINSREPQFIQEPPRTARRPQYPVRILGRDEFCLKR
jgi:hypothetical protein